MLSKFYLRRQTLLPNPFLISNGGLAVKGAKRLAPSLSDLHWQQDGCKELRKAARQKRFVW